jgi:predicted MFS family arabinose efflux permease
VALSCSLMSAGLLVMGASTSYAWLMLGRVIAGGGIGVSFVVVPVYISELSPPEVRGSMGALVRDSTRIYCRCGAPRCEDPTLYLSFPFFSF